MGNILRLAFTVTYKKKKKLNSKTDGIKYDKSINKLILLDLLMDNDKLIFLHKKKKKCNENLWLLTFIEWALHTVFIWIEIIVLLVLKKKKKIFGAFGTEALIIDSSARTLWVRSFGRIGGGVVVSSI